MQQFGVEMVSVINGQAPNEQKKELLKPTIETHVDVSEIAKFCLGRFWRKATPDQQARFTTIFHRVLLNQIASHLGEYQGVSYTIKETVPSGDDVAVNTTIVRPNAPTANVQWVVSTKSGSPKIIDVIAEGTSMRLTQRNDYASFLSSHGDDIDALITAMTQKLDNPG
jgi:phospholipid transport system substrate-binding protein